MTRRKIFISAIVGLMLSMLCIVCSSDFSINNILFGDAGNVTAYAATCTNGHSYTSKITKAATCTTKGTRKYTCTKCSYSYTKSIAAKGHKAGKAATCTTAQTCTTCKAVLKAKLGHKYSSSYTVDKKATCTAAGSKSKHCTRSGCTAKTSVTTIKATGHSWAAATCTTAKTCKTCKATSGSKLGHKYSSSYTVDKKATCTAAGSKSKHCTRSGCTAKTSVTTIKATGHKYTYKTTKAATCTASGTRKYTCSNCSYSYNKTVAAKGHTAGADATCTKAQTCTVCNVELAAKLGHKYTYKTTKAATCTATGTRKYTCSRCSYSYNKTVAAKGHTEGDAATCTTAQTCTVCNVELAAKLGHKYTYKTTKAATCTATGTRKYTCSRCSYSYNKTVAAKGHTEGDAATCTTAQTCTVCNVELVAKLGHKYTYKTTKAATCTATGTRKYTCSRCSYSYNKTVAAKGHTEGEAATCTTAQTCTVCNVELAAKLGHKYTSKVTKEATCNETGTRKYTCSRCTYSYNKTIATIAHTYTEATMIDDKTHSTACDVCGTTVSSQAHTLKTEYNNATCTTDAYNLTYCELCTYAEIETDENNKATGHTKAFLETIEATCTAGGYDTFECTVCKAMLPTENHTAQLAHTYVKNNDLSYDATCTTPGVTVMTCEVCGDRDEDIIHPATGHLLVEDDDEFQDEINNNGCITMNYICANANCSEILKTEEHYRYKINKVLPTCTEEGTNTYVCRGSDCGITIKVETVPPKGHDLTPTIVPPTCTTDGSYSYSSGHCEACNEDIDSSEKVIIPATGHTLNIENATCTTASYCTNRNCTYVKSNALGHDYSIENCEISDSCTGFYCNRCGNLLETKAEKLNTYNALLNKMILRAYSQERNLSFIHKEITDITYTELDFGIYTSLVKDLFDESMQGTETNYIVYNNRTMYGNYKPLNVYRAASDLEESDIRSISVLTLSELKASSLFTDLDAQITAANGESFDTTAYANKTFKDVIRVTVNVNNENLTSIRALKENQNPALSKLYAINVKEDLADYLYGPKVEKDDTGFIMEIAISSLNTSGNTTYYFDAETYEPIAAVYNISVVMSQHIDMSFETGIVNLSGTMSPKETTVSQNIYLFDGFFA